MKKIHEEMISLFDSPNTIDCKNFFVIYPSQEMKNFRKKIMKGISCTSQFRYSSDTNKHFLKIQDLKKINHQTKKIILNV